MWNTRPSQSVDIFELRRLVLGMIEINANAGRIDSASFMYCVDAVEMLDWLRKQVVIRTDCPPHEAVYSHEKKQIICGEFVNSPREGFTQKLQRLREKSQIKKR